MHGRRLLFRNCTSLAYFDFTVRKTIRRTLNLSALNVVADSLWTPPINLAANTERRAENLLGGALERGGHGFVAHRASDLDDLVERDGLGVLDVLLLLTISRRLLERFDDERGGGWDDRDSGLTVLDCEADGHAETFLYEALERPMVWVCVIGMSYPVSRRLGNVFTDLFRRQTERADLGREGGRSTNLAAGGAQVNDLLLVRVEFGS